MNIYMNKLTRRTFIIATTAASLSIATARTRAQYPEKPPLLLHLFANGGWDVASFCDPKVNINTKVNSWAEHTGPGQAGVFTYAPIGNNSDFFHRHQDKLLVINGVNAKTNVHSAGRLMSITGIGKNNFPSICAQHAATFGAQLPMPLLGNAFETAGTIAAAQINGGLLQLLTIPTQTDSQYLDITQRQLLDDALAKHSRLIKNTKSRDFYLAAISSEQKQFSAVVELAQSLKASAVENSALVSDLKFTLAAFAAGASLACDYSLYGFDTHDNHDKLMLTPLNNITQAASLAWEFAAQLGIADRLVVILSSEFARTPFYNDVAGKDHWPFHSVIVMKQNPSWQTAVIGQTDEKLIGLPLDPISLRANPNGSLIDAGKIHRSLRAFLGINPKFEQAYPLESGPVWNFFG
jgi:hypothetical protein